ncbi:hypothetical protein QJS04_geneDACA014491 [Acorus gramineus]|uniref:Uncharacterized protein n=1 Tax=Acorus gramineus TaxID=55184 RepID=A0AAV9AQD0_ACOGR|nr:hypothetical protein QJS04_geneDACA014491 [Acorus gramineus]
MDKPVDEEEISSAKAVLLGALASGVNVTHCCCSIGALKNLTSGAELFTFICRSGQPSHILTLVSQKLITL